MRRKSETTSGSSIPPSDQAVDKNKTEKAGSGLADGHRTEGGPLLRNDCQDLGDFGVQRVSQPCNIRHEIRIRVEGEEEFPGIAQDRDAESTTILERPDSVTLQKLGSIQVKRLLWSWGLQDRHLSGLDVLECPRTNRKQSPETG